MAQVATQRTTRRLIQTIRQRVRLRSRLRAVREKWRRRFPPRLPAWAGPVPGDAVAPAPPEDERLDLAVDTTSALRVQLHGVDAGIRELSLTVHDWQRPVPGWSGRLGPLPGLLHQEIRLPAGDRGPVAVRVTLAAPVPVRRILAALLPALEPSQPFPTPLSPDVAAGDASFHWLRPEPANLLAALADVDGIVRPYDVVLAASSPVPAGACTGSPYGVTSGGDVTVLVDATTANPRGREGFGAELPVADLHVVDAADGGWWQISRDPDDILVAGRVGDPLDARQRATLARLRAVVGGDPTTVPPVAEAAATAQLAMTGLILHRPTLAEPVAALLATDLVETLRRPLPGADPVEWELRSVVQRRAALRAHATAFALPRVVAGAYPVLARPPAVSALLVSRRPGHVPAAVAALAAQTYPELEIIVGLHGCDLSPADRERIAGHGRPVRVVPIPGASNLGEALGEATRWASGSLLTKVDDDDRYGPEHVWDLVLARHYSGATVVGKGAEFVHLQLRGLTVRRWMGSELFTDVVAGGTMLLSRGDLEDAGGWRPMARSVDRGLLDRVRRAGGLVYRTHPFGFVYTRHGDGHTWDPGVAYFLADPRQKWRGLPPYAEFGGT